MTKVSFNKIKYLIPVFFSDSQYREYFDISYSKNTVSVTILKSLPSDAIKGNSVITLTLTVGIQKTIHTSSAVLNIAIHSKF